LTDTSPHLQHVSIGIAADGPVAARVFYGDVLGLAERSLPAGVDPDRFIWYRLDEGADLHLHVLDRADPPAARDHFCLVVGAGLDALRARVVGAGIETRAPVERLGARSFYCRDPFGNLIEFAEGLE
jgi:catechol 2,3-dioxygenase-like lactoylglutathione lyase family enzyme